MRKLVDLGFKVRIARSDLVLGSQRNKRELDNLEGLTGILISQ